MILADSNILIDYYRNRESELAKKIDSLPVAICGVVKSEVLHGARTNQEIDNILASFTTFELLHTDEYDFEGIGFMLQTLRENGITLPMAVMEYCSPMGTPIFNRIRKCEWSSSQSSFLR